MGGRIAGETAHDRFPRSGVSRRVGPGAGLEGSPRSSHRGVRRLPLALLLLPLPCLDFRRQVSSVTQGPPSVGILWNPGTVLRYTAHRSSARIDTGLREERALV